MWLRVIRPKTDEEILINTNNIWKITVKYAVREGEGDYWQTTSKHGIANPDAVRIYTIYAGSETIILPSDPNSPVVAEIEKIYKSAIKDPD